MVIDLPKPRKENIEGTRLFSSAVQNANLSVMCFLVKKIRSEI
jgi:hypothetical protein